MSLRTRHDTDQGTPVSASSDTSGYVIWGATELQVRRRHIRRRTTQRLILVLEETIAATQFPHLGSLVRALAVTVAFLDIGLAEPVLKCCFADTEAGGDLLESDTALAATSDRDNVFAELWDKDRA